ncbi:MAG: hypothetical protein P0S95_07350 [Rhabdochlamydiaceae bacterium]|nr:hypothetical protein [Candidatus Amphrikana amoebophyrae]
MAQDELAEESQKTLRDRRKLQLKFEEIDQQITNAAIEHAAFRIRERINRLAALRVPLGNSFELFDSNRNPKDLSDRVKKIAGDLGSIFKIFPTSAPFIVDSFSEGNNDS